MPRLLVAGFAALMLAACRPAGEPLTGITLIAMATTVELTLPEAALREQPLLIAAIEADLQDFGRDYYAWGDGELALLNRALTAGGSYQASVAMTELLREAQEIALQTGGAFDPGVGLLVELWGFHDAAGENPAPPGASMVASALQTGISIAELEFSDSTVQTTRAGRVLLDLGGIAKGAAVDRIVAQLEATGVAPALVNAGGDLRVIGERADRPWRIGIQDPRSDGLLGTLELLAGEAAFSSGDYERYYELDGERLHHIIDPRTGYPAQHTQAITVIAAEGLIADAAATALFVAGPERWREMARRLGIDAVLRIDASGAVEMTAQMRDRFQPGAAAGSDIIAAGN